MKALTVQQPWAWAIVHGGKDVENRTQVWSYRGPLAIHAGARISQRGVESPLVEAALADASFHDDPGTPRVLGAIIGVVDLVDAHRSMGSWSRDNVWQPTCCESPWAENTYAGRSELVHLEFADPRPLAEPIPCRGALGLWTPPADVLAQVQEQLR